MIVEIKENEDGTGLVLEVQHTTADEFLLLRAFLRQKDAASGYTPVCRKAYPNRVVFGALTKEPVG